MEKRKKIHSETFLAFVRVPSFPRDIRSEKIHSPPRSEQGMTRRKATFPLLESLSATLSVSLESTHEGMTRPSTKNTDTKKQDRKWFQKKRRKKPRLSLSFYLPLKNFTSRVYNPTFSNGVFGRGIHSLRDRPPVLYELGHQLTDSREKLSGHAMTCFVGRSLFCYPVFFLQLFALPIFSPSSRFFAGLFRQGRRKAGEGQAKAVSIEK